MKTAFVIRHVAFEDLGSFQPVIEGFNYNIVWHEAGQKPLPQAALAADLLVVLGGPIGVYDSADYPCIHQEVALVRERLASDAPTLGICLGSQIMAAALGAKVYPGAAGKEIGWAPLTLTEEGQASTLAEIGPANTSVLHWHGDTFDLLPGMRLLASTPRYPHQAFSSGQRGLALQFHPEVTTQGLESWFIGHTGEIAATPGVSVAQLRADSERLAPALGFYGTRFLGRWLTDIAT